MGSPTFNVGHSTPDPQAADAATQLGPDVMRSSDGARVLARPVSSAPHRAPVAVPGNAAVPAPVLGVDIETLVTEDDTPVDNMPSEKQQLLLTEPLFSSWSGPGGGRSFVAAANVGVFPEPRNPAIVPDVFVSLDVQVHENWWDKAHRSYFVWEFGKPPELVVEIVSNQKGREVGRKRQRYAAMGVEYYVINDPLHQVMDDELRIYRLRGGNYERQESPRFPELRLGLTLWDGEFEAVRHRWLRWVDAHGVLIPTGENVPSTWSSCWWRSATVPSAWRHCCAARASIRGGSECRCGIRRVRESRYPRPQGSVAVKRTVSRADAEHEDPTIGAFLDLLERDIEAGRLVEQPPDGLARIMLEDAELDVGLHEPIEGDVDL